MRRVCAWSSSRPAPASSWSRPPPHYNPTPAPCYSALPSPGRLLVRPSAETRLFYLSTCVFFHVFVAMHLPSPLSPPCQPPFPPTSHHLQWYTITTQPPQPPQSPTSITAATSTTPTTSTTHQPQATGGALVQRLNIGERYLGYTPPSPLLPSPPLSFSLVEYPLLSSPFLSSPSLSSNHLSFPFSFPSSSTVYNKHAH